MATKITNLIEHREHPKSVKPFMRFQVGEIRRHPLSFPFNQRDLSAGYYNANADTDIFHLIGFGETAEAAEKMAGL
jgi:hypothetical protein